MARQFPDGLARAVTLLSVVLAGFGTAAIGQTAAPAAPKTKAKAAAKEAAPKAAALLDLNKATAEELADQLPGVGAVTAKKIVAGRPYAKVDDLARAGVPAKTIEGLRGLVTVSPPPPVLPAPAPKPKAAMTKERAKDKGAAPAPQPKPIAGKRVNINKASKEELDVLPGIGPVRAQAIIEGRPFKTIDDIKNVKGIKDVEFSKIKDMIAVD